MAKLLKLRRGTTTQHGSFTGAEGEVTVDTDKETLVVHDGSTAGGHPVAAEDMANVTAANIKGRLGSTLTNTEVNSSAAIAGTKIAPDFGSQNVVTTGTLGSGEITTTGHINLEDNKNIKLGNSQDLLIYHNGQHSIINDNGTGNLQLVTNQGAQITLQGGSDTMANFIKDAQVELYYDNSKKFKTTSTGVGVMGSLAVESDSQKLTVGSGNDLEIYHDGTDSHIYHSTGHPYNDLLIRATADIKIQTNNTENAVVCNVNGSTDLYHDNSKKFETTSGGASVTGNLDVSSGVDVTGNITVTGNVDGKDISALGITGTTLSNGVTATTQSASDNSTKVATTAYVETAVSNLVDSSPGALNTLNELAAAVNDDANFSTTITNSIATKMPLSGGTFTGAVSGTTFADSKGNVRSIIINNKTSAYTLVAADAGKAIYISSGGVTVPNGVFSAGDAITIVNNSGSSQTITQGSNVTLYNTADAATGNRTLLQRGMATLWWANSSDAYISGSGLE